MNDNDITKKIDEYTMVGGIELGWAGPEGKKRRKTIAEVGKRLTRIGKDLAQAAKDGKMGTIQKLSQEIVKAKFNFDQAYQKGRIEDKSKVRSV